jgi:ABC-2 type transport system ATP-binding protein
MNNIIEVNSLVKEFASKRAINDLSFTVNPGEIFGLLGPNGAGKTTTIRVLNGLLPVTGGEVRIFGENPITSGEMVRSRVGVLTETPALYERLSAYENLMFSGRLAGIPETALEQRISEIMKFFDLADRMKDKCAGFSKGMKQRMALARALLHRPELIYLDEPTSSLDPESAQQVNGLIDKISHEDGQTVFLCTHNLLEAQRLCDRVAVINHGELLALGSMDDLAKSLFPGVWVEIEFLHQLAEDMVVSIKDLPGIQQLRSVGSVLHIQVADNAVTSDIVLRLSSINARIMRVTPREVTLEEVYFALQNHQSGAL